MADAKKGEYTTTVKKVAGKNEGVPEKLKVTPGKCPCSICGHKTMQECYEADCQCCSSVCT